VQCGGGASVHKRKPRHLLRAHQNEFFPLLFCDHHLIVTHKALLPTSTFEDEDDDNSESKIDVGVD
jgi:hypothetical protein